MSTFSAPIQRVEETCSCGAEYRATGMFATTYAAEWRDQHACKVETDRHVEAIRSRWREANLAKDKFDALGQLHDANQKIAALQAELDALANPKVGKGR